MSVLFYISGHGFGHASRDVEVINALSACSAEPVVIRSEVNPDLLRRTLRVPYDLLPGPCDTGVIQASSITQDDAATVEAALRFYETFEARVEADVERLTGRGVRLVVGDIPPLAFAVAARLGVPSVALGNFTWDWIYETHPGFLPRGAAVLERIRAAYRQATLALELPFSGGFEIFERVVRLPLIARRASQPRSLTRAFFGVPTAARVALLSFGGYGLPALDLASIDAGDWVIVTTDRVTRNPAAGGSRVRTIVESAFLEGPYRYEDLVAAVDVVITKPGYGIISECISTGTAMLYTTRGDFREYPVLVDALPRYVRAQFIDPRDLLAGRWSGALAAVMAMPEPPERLSADGAGRAAEILMTQMG